jgi:hypothetical protein
MKQLVGTVILAGTLLVPFASGCSRTISEKETVKHKADGTKSVDRETLKERPDGTVVRETEKSRQ